MTLPPSLAGIKIVLIPISGDVDLFISFSTPHPQRDSATWVEEYVGVKQFILGRSNLYYCPPPATASSAGGCTLHLAVSGFEEGNFKLVVYNYTEGTAEGTANAQVCHRGPAPQTSRQDPRQSATHSFEPCLLWTGQRADDSRRIVRPVGGELEPGLLAPAALCKRARLLRAG